MTKPLGVFLLAAVLAAFSWPVSAQPDEREAIIGTVARVSQSVGALYAQQEGGDIRFLCSATAVAREGDATVILTAKHCLEKGVSYLINFGDNRLRSLNAWQVPHYEVDPGKYPRVYNEPQTDMALFLMPGTDIPLVNMAVTSKDLRPGAKVVMVGYPLGLSKISYEGIVAGRLNRLGSDYYDYLLLQIFGAPGSSGSAVINVETGKVIGVLVAGKGGVAGLPVIFATPIEYREHLMEVAPGGAASAK